jgi:hypothetical protein
MISQPGAGPLQSAWAAADARTVIARSAFRAARQEAAEAVAISISFMVRFPLFQEFRVKRHDNKLGERFCQRRHHHGPHQLKRVNVRWLVRGAGFALVYLSSFISHQCKIQKSSRQNTTTRTATTVSGITGRALSRRHGACTTWRRAASVLGI